PTAADEYYLQRVERQVLPNLARLIGAFRRGGIEVIYTVIESLTADGRDRSLDHKLSDMHVPRGSRLGKVVEEIAPAGDEMVIPKTASGVFNATNMEYVLRNLGVEYLVVAGVFTNQCVESAVRDAADRGFMVTTVEDCCATKTQAWHDAALVTLGGYSRLRSADQVIGELGAPARAAASR
ncbi:MAG: isochorismatase family cysteine hydrolase, partial [Dongiaceae bacterium]